jgi:NAD(P)-dependent dehydrogenase (short-subunit alcohol dehydrogenase family)
MTNFIAESDMATKGVTARFRGQTAVVVGGAVGWGRACALRLAAEHASVLVIDAAERSSAAESVVSEIRGRSGTASSALADPSDLGELTGVARTCLGAGAACHVLVTNHMAIDWASIEDCDIDRFAETVRYNLVGPVAAVKAFLPNLRAAQRASVVLLGSVDGLYGNPRVPSYSASKGGIVPLTHVMAYELAGDDIRVNAIASAQTIQPSAELLQGPPPGAPGWEGFPGPDYYRQLGEATPLKRYGSMEDWAGAVSFLASDDAAYVTGSVLVVDCGRTGLTPGTQ